MVDCIVSIQGLTYFVAKPLISKPLSLPARLSAFTHSFRFHDNIDKKWYHFILGLLDMSEILLKALKEGNIDYLRSFLENTGKGVTSDSKQIMLMHACHYGHLDIMRLLIDANASIELADARQRTALTYATLSGSVACMKLLLDAKAHPDSPASAFSPLYCASQYGFLEKVRLLLEARASIFVWADGSRYWTSASIAEENGHQDVVRLLQDANAAPTDDDLMLMYEACAKGRVKDVRRLLNEGFPLIFSGNTLTPLQLAAQHGRSAILELLLAARCDVNEHSWNGVTPLHYAVMKHDAKCTFMLLQAGASVNPPFSDMSPLLYAIEYGYEEIVNQLLLFKADVNTKGESNVTALICTVVCERTSIAKTLIRLGADVNMCDASDRSPLTYAVECNNIELARLLIDANADVNTRDRRHSLAEGDRNHGEPISAPSGKWAQQPAHLGSGSPLICAAAAGNVDMVRLLLDAQANVDKANELGVTALIWAATNCHAAATRVLIDAKAEVNVCDAVVTPLMASTLRGRSDTTVVLLEARAAVNARGVARRTALCFAAAFGNVAATRVLIGARASLKHTASDRMDALTRATAGRHYDVMQVLIAAKADLDGGAWAPDYISDCKYRGEPTPLRRAVCNNDEQAIRILLEAKADLGSYSHFCHKAPLCDAIKHNHANIVKLLLDAKADHNCDPEGPNHLLLATRNDQLAVMKLLIGAKASLEPDFDESGYDPNTCSLLAAIKNSNVAAVQMLIDAKASVKLRYQVDHEDHDGVDILTYLLTCSRFRPKNEATFREVVRLLAKAGASMDVLFHPDFETSWDPFKIMLEANISLDEHGALFNYKLHDAVSNEDYRIVKMLLKNKVSVDVPDEDGRTALMTAVSTLEDGCNMSQLLLGANASLEARDNKHNTALMHAIPHAEENDCKILRLLLIARASLESTGKHGDTPLLSAIRHRAEQAAMLFIDAKANVNTKNQRGVTPLMLEIKLGGETDLLDELLERKASLKEEDAFGKTALMCAAAKRSENLVYRLLESVWEGEVEYECDDEDIDAQREDTVSENHHAKSECDLNDANCDDNSDESASPRAKRFKT